MTFTYYPNIPNAPDDPQDDQPLMQVNSTSIGNLVNVDHIGFNLPNGGLHRQVNMFNQNAPTLLADILLHSKVSGGQNSLWVKNATYDLPLFTGAPLGAPNGSSSLFGGIVIQWGSESPYTGTITYSPAFSSPAYAILLTGIGTTSANGCLVVTNSTASGFTYSKGVTGVNINGAYWIAIGQ